MRKHLVKPLLSLTLLSLLFMAACSGRSAANDANVGAPSTEVLRRSVIDDLGRPVLVPVQVSRVVSTAPSATEMIFAAGGGDRLVGVTTFCNYPAEAKKIAKIGDTMNPNLEAIIALHPDVVFVSTASQIEAFTRTLEQNGIAVFVTDAKNLDGVLQNLIRLGEIFGTPDPAGQAAAGLKQRIDAISTRLRDADKVRVFVQISREPLFTIGKQSYLVEPIARAGGLAVTADIETAFPKLSKETALSLRPEVIIVSDSPDNPEPNEAFKNSPAVKNGRVYRIDPDIISRPGPRLVDALEQIARDLHPEKFN